MSDMCDDIPHVCDLVEPWRTITHRIYVDFPDFAAGWKAVLRSYPSHVFSSIARSWLNSMFSEMAPWSDEMVYNYPDKVFDHLLVARKLDQSWQASDRPGYRGNACFEWPDYGCDARVPVTDVRSTRQFNTGATRDEDHDKLDYEGFLSPVALEAFAVYMHMKRQMPDGSLRASDNWQKGIPLDSYMKSMLRHVMTVWKHHRGVADPAVDETLWEALCGLMFNVQGYLHETQKGEEDDGCDPAEIFRYRV